MVRFIAVPRTARALAGQALVVWMAVALALALGCESDKVGAVAPVVTVVPTHLDFGTLELGQEAVHPIFIRDLEAVPALITRVELVDDCGGCFITLAEVREVAPYSTVEMPVRFRAVRLEIATATVTIATNDPKAAVHKVTMVGRGADTRVPDIEVAPARVDFGFVPAGGVAIGSFVVRSTGTNDLLIDRLRIEPPDAPYRVTTSTPSPSRPGRLAPGAQASVRLRAMLPDTETGTITARLFIETNVPKEKNVPGLPGVVEVPLSSLANLPPLAIAGPDLTVERHFKRPEPTAFEARLLSDIDFKAVARLCAEQDTVARRVGIEMDFFRLGRKRDD